MLSNPGGSVQWPKGRCAHSSVLIGASLSEPHTGSTSPFVCLFVCLFVRTSPLIIRPSRF